MDTSSNDFWDKLINELQPVLEMGQELVFAVESLCLNHQIDLSLPVATESISPSLQKELRTVIERIIDTSGSFSLSPFIKSHSLYLSMIGQLDACYQKLNRNDNSARYFILNLMEEIICVSIENKVMKLSDWKKYLEQCRETTKIKDAIGHVFKRVSLDKAYRNSCCVYDFFYNDHSPEEIDRFLNQAKESLLLAQKHRNTTKKRGQGLSRHVISFVHHWQDVGAMKPMKSVFPFCQLLQKYWDEKINLGSRQGLEASYKQRV